MLRTSKKIFGLSLLAIVVSFVLGYLFTLHSSYDYSTLPGSSAFNTALKLKIQNRKHTENYKPRTKHFSSDNKAKYVNRLYLETSPYLLQHAHNPVNWYPWGEEAFTVARQLNKPILLSIGYSTCHWCHVMEEESFEDIEIATYLNQNYVAIKVDREERPDIDSIYMTAVQAMTGRGGWPMTVWLTADGKPFYGGSYFPPRDGDRGVEYGFLTLLKQLNSIYKDRPEQIAAAGTQLQSILETHLQPTYAESLPNAEPILSAVSDYQQRYDSNFGGLQGAPKFPSSLPIRLLLRHYRRTNDQQSLTMAIQTLRNMAAGGIYDHIGGGFHRYATDAKWLVPHFEKMLYDNALLSIAYLEAYQLSDDAHFKYINEDILHYVQRDMTAPSGAFYSATDADSLSPTGHREEGWFFTWTIEEIDAALDPESANLIKRYYQLSNQGNFAGRNILHTAESLAAVAKELSLSEEQANSIIRAAREKLYQERQQRPKPLRDEKILTSWNGLMISAFARSGLVLHNDKFIQSATNAANFILQQMHDDGQLQRSYAENTAYIDGFLDDYAFFIAGLLDLYEATMQARWLQAAILLDNSMQKLFEDNEGGGFFRISEQHEALLTREKPLYDGAEPSGNSVAIMNLLRLQEFTAESSYSARATKALKAFAGTLQTRPANLAEMLLAVDFFLDYPKEVIIVTPTGKIAEAKPFIESLRKTFLPNRILTVAEEGDQLEQLANLVPLLAGKHAMRGKTTAYVCEKGICKLPTTEPDIFAKQISVTQPY